MEFRKGGLFPVLITAHFKSFGIALFPGPVEPLPGEQRRPTLPERTRFTQPAEQRTQTCCRAGEPPAEI